MIEENCVKVTTDFLSLGPLHFYILLGHIKVGSYFCESHENIWRRTIHNRKQYQP